MIHFKFDSSDNKPFIQVDTLFNQHFENSWINDNDFAKRLLLEIDNSEWIDGSILFQRMFETRYSIANICHGTKAIILQKYFPDKWIRSTGIGCNIYPLLKECPWDLHFIGRTNFYLYGELKGCTFNCPVYLEDFNVTIQDKFQFDNYLYRWKHGTFPCKHAGV